MRILHVVHGFVPEAVGGVELHCHYLANALAAAHAVGVLAWRSDPANPDYSVEERRQGPLTVWRLNHRFADLSSFTGIYRNDRIDGIFDDLDVAFCWHAATFNGVMAVRSLANIQVYFRFKGRAAHAAGAPHLGRSALDAVELTSVGVNYLREHMPSDCRVHYAVTNSGGISPNVVQANAEVLYLVRAPDVVKAKALYERAVAVIS